jgi:hypothetical protein
MNGSTYIALEYQTPVCSFDYTPVDISSVIGLKYLNNSLAHRLQDQCCVRDAETLP